MKHGFKLTGIYREEYENNKFRILIIPYDIVFYSKIIFLLIYISHILKII